MSVVLLNPVVPTITSNYCGMEYGPTWSATLTPCTHRAIGQCALCGLPLCKRCAEETEKGLFCPTCKEDTLGSVGASNVPYSWLNRQG